jgi:hypothetical protein
LETLRWVAFSDKRIMKIPMALIADEANISQEGKLHVLGVFDRIASATFPMVHPKMVYVFRVEAGYGDGGRPVPVRVRLIDADGGTLFEAGGEIVAPEVEPGDFATAHQLFTLLGIQFPQAGMYKFVVEVGDLTHETPIATVQSPWLVGGQSRDN